MNKLVAVLIASALLSPGIAHAENANHRKAAAHVAMKRHAAKKAKAAPKDGKTPAQSSVSSVRSPDYPWLLPG